MELARYPWQRIDAFDHARGDALPGVARELHQSLSRSSSTSCSAASMAAGSLPSR